MQGSVGLMLHLEGHGLGQRPMRRPEPKDHLKENVRRMRQIQKQCRQRDDEGQKPVKALWKSTKYEGVQSKIKDDLEKPPPTPRPTSANYLRAHSRTGFVARPSSASNERSSPDPDPDKLTVPKAHSARNVKLQRHDIDFIKANGRAVKFSSMKRSPSLTALDDLKKKQDEEERNYKKGAVPKYLQNRQKQWREEEETRRANEPDPDMPPGHKLMPQDERKDTLEKLKQSKFEVERKMASLPIRTDTLRLRTVKQQLEDQLAEIEEAIKIFSRPKVFVKTDE